MKKLSNLLILLFLCSSSIWAAAPELKFKNTEDRIEVQNFNENKKTICKDNVRFLNQTNSLLLFRVYGKKDSESSEEFLCNVLVKPKDTQMESCEKDIGNYKYVYIQCISGEASFSKITCEHSDMYLYVSSFKEGEKSTDKELPSFWGINWGTSRGESKKIIANKGNYQLVEDSASHIAYKGKFGGENTTIVLSFFENQFYRGVVIYPYEENKALSIYQSVKDQITKKYGVATKSVETFQKPYYKGDGYEEQAIRTNKGTYVSSWTFSDKNNIMVGISNDLETVLYYENFELAEKNKKIEDEKIMEDF